MRLVFIIAVAAVLLGAKTISAQPVDGRIKGAPAVNLRTAASADSPAITWLAENQRVQVLRIEDDWMFVRTAAGTSGYVHKDYVALDRPFPTRPPPTLTPTVAPTVDATRLTPARRAAPVAEGAKPEDAREMKEHNAQLEAALEHVRSESEDVPARLEASPTALPQTPEMAELRKEVSRVLHLTEQIYRHQLKGSANENHDLAGSSPTGSLVLFGVGVLIGVLIGVAYGRRSERSRRGRIRL